MMTIQKKLRSKKGFTLIELIVVIAILAILAAIAIPRLAGFTDTAELRSDYATATTLGHAAAAAYSENPANFAAIDFTYLTTNELVPAATATTAQSSGGTWDVSVADNGDVTVTDGTDTFYPEP